MRNMALGKLLADGTQRSSKNQVVKQAVVEKLHSESCWLTARYRFTTLYYLLTLHALLLDISSRLLQRQRQNKAAARVLKQR